MFTNSLASAPFSCLNLPSISPPTRRQLFSHEPFQVIEREYRQQQQPQNDDTTVYRNETKKRRKLATSKCVKTASQLKSQTQKSSKVTVCTERVRLGSTARRLQQQGRLLQSNISNGIDISNKNLIVTCRLRRQRQCILDAEGLTRIFHGSNTTVEFRNLKFANGYHPNSGGALQLEGGSKATMTNCTFVNNTAPAGSTLSVHDTELILNGGGGKNNRTALITSKGNGAPIEMFSSKASLKNVYFAANKLSQYVSYIISAFLYLY
jgi:hypothetical protein